jgi:hypothetical protein
MLKIITNYEPLQFNKDNWLIDFKYNVQELLKRAATAFVDTAANRGGNSGVEGTPVVSGFAKGSFITNVRTFEGSIVSSEYYLPVPIPIYGQDPDGKRQPPGTYSSYTFAVTKELTSFTFNFKTEVPYYLENDTTDMAFKQPQKTTPWHLFRDGGRAFMNVIDTELLGVIPQLEKYIVPKGATPF